MAETVKRRRGAPKGNRNAVKHGFYSRAFNKVEQSDYLLAAGVEGFSEEIDLLRYEIKKPSPAAILKISCPSKMIRLLS